MIQVRQPIYTRSVGRWRNYETTLADLFANLPIDPEPTVREGGNAPQSEAPALAMI